MSFPDIFLFEQLGTEQTAHKVTRSRLRKLLKAIKMYWPVQAKFEDGYFELQPSPPAVQHRVKSKTPITIVDKSVEN